MSDKELVTVKREIDRLERRIETINKEAADAITRLARRIERLEAAQE